MSRIAVGADIGGSHITCQLYDLDNHALVEGTRVSTPVDCNGPKDEILDQWTRAIQLATNGYPLSELQGIGFAMPGPFDYPNGVAWFEGVEKFDTLHGVDVRGALHKRLSLPNGFPVRFLNDASCFAIGESFQGEASAYDRFLAVTLGTGFGTTFIDHHLPVAGIDGVPDDGFLYHIPFKDSNADNHFSTRWFVREYKRLTGKQISGAKELAEMAPCDPVATEIFCTFGKNLAFFLTPWLKRFKAECLVIGGNISAGCEFFCVDLKTHLIRAGVDIQIINSSLQEDAALSGSASLCDDVFYSKLSGAVSP